LVDVKRIYGKRSWVRKGDALQIGFGTSGQVTSSCRGRAELVDERAITYLAQDRKEKF